MTKHENKEEQKFEDVAVEGADQEVSETKATKVKLTPEEKAAKERERAEERERKIKEREEKRKRDMEEKQKAREEAAQKKEAERREREQKKASEREAAAKKRAEAAEAKAAERRKLAEERAKEKEAAAAERAKLAEKRKAEREQERSLKNHEKEEQKAKRKAERDERRQRMEEIRESRRDGGRRPHSNGFIFLGVESGLSNPQEFSTRGKVLATLVKHCEVGQQYLISDVDALPEIKELLFGGSVRTYLSKLEDVNFVEMIAIQQEVKDASGEEQLPLEVAEAAAETFETNVSEVESEEADLED